MNLKDLREYIANITDYDVTGNDTYTTQLNNVINEQYRKLFSEKPFTFAQKEVKLKVYTDVTATCTGSYNPTNDFTVMVATANVPTWIEGNIVEINGIEYEVMYINPSVQTTFYISGNLGTIASTTVKFKQRFIRLPHDVISLLQVGFRSYTVSPTEVGRYIPMTRYEDEYYNLPLDEVNIPNYWVQQDGISLRSPNLAPTVQANTTVAGQGDRTVQVAFSWVKYNLDTDLIELESGLSPFTDTLTLTDTQELQIVNMPTYVPFGLWKRYYIIDADDPSKFSSIIRVGEFNSITGGNQNISFTEDDFNNMYFNLENKRYAYTEGYLQRIRLYPRQSEDYEISVRYLYKPQPLQEDTDTPQIPVSHHLILAYGSLIDILNKHDNTQLALVYQAKFDQEMIKLEQRFLTQQPRRFIKGYMQNSGVDTLPMFTPLKRIP